jgi:hypothetical protein
MTAAKTSAATTVPASQKEHTELLRSLTFEVNRAEDDLTRVEREIALLKNSLEDARAMADIQVLDAPCKNDAERRATKVQILQNNADYQDALVQLKDLEESQMFLSLAKKCAERTLKTEQLIFKIVNEHPED